MSSDFGEVCVRSVQFLNSSGSPVAPDATPTWTVTLPDGTAGTPPAVQSGGTGEFYVNYVSPQAGRHEDLWSGLISGQAERYSAVFHVRPTTPGPILDLVEAKRHLRITSTDIARDEQLRDFLDAATELCEDYVGRCYRRRTVVETFDGGRAMLQLTRTPVISVTNVVEQGTSVASTGWVLDTGAGILTRGSTSGASTWTSGPSAVVVTYVAGTPVVPARVRQAVKVTLAHLWATQRGGSGLPQQVDQEDYSPNAPGWSLPRSAEQLLMTDVAPGFA